MNCTEILKQCKAGEYGPEMQALFLDPHADPVVQLLAICFLAKPPDERRRFLEQMKQEQCARISLDEIQDSEAGA